MKKILVSHANVLRFEEELDRALRGIEKENLISLNYSTHTNSMGYIQRECLIIYKGR